MKKISKYILLLSLLAVFLVSSCSKDSETTFVVTRATLTGKWLVSESKKKNTYEVTIFIDSTTTNGILINNFAGAGTNVNALAYLSGTTLELPSNELLSNGWIVNGNGKVTTATHIDWPFSLDDGANSTTVKAVFTKK